MYVYFSWLKVKMKISMYKQETVVLQVKLKLITKLKSEMQLAIYTVHPVF